MKEKEMPEILILDEEERKEHRKKEKKKKIRNRELAGVTYFFVSLFLLLMAYIVYFQVVKSKEMINSPYNARLDSMSDRVVRGNILDQNKNILAETIVGDDGSETRNYPYGKLYAHVVGYDALGKSGLESLENFNLLTSDAFFVEKIVKELKEEKNIGNNIVTTLDTDVQKAAYDALGSYNGAVVALEASTGKVIAMVSKPTYDPNTIVSDWDWLIADEQSRLLNRATQGAYAPGSVFKIATALEYIRENPDYVEYTYECDGAVTEGETTIHCAGKRAHGLENMEESFANSCNASFVNIGLNLDLKSYQKTAKELLFNTKLPNLLPYTQSKFRLTKDADVSEVMMTAMGQGKTQVSPYHMALLTSAIANGGILMKPYLVDHVENYTGTVVDKNLPEKYKKLLNSDEAAILKQYMSAVVSYGTGTALSDAEYSVAGKTGTAEYSSDKEKSHSWFTGFSNVDNPELVISVVVESADNSGMSAVSVAKKVFDAYYY